MTLHAFDGVAGDSRPLRQLAVLWRYKTVEKDEKDFHKSNVNFNYFLDMYILACLMNMMKAKTLAELDQCLCQNNLPNAMVIHTLYKHDILPQLIPAKLK